MESVIKAHWHINLHRIRLHGLHRKHTHLTTRLCFCVSCEESAFVWWSEEEVLRVEGRIYDSLGLMFMPYGWWLCVSVSCGDLCAFIKLYQHSWSNHHLLTIALIAAPIQRVGVWLVVMYKTPKMSTSWNIWTRSHRPLTTKVESVLPLEQSDKHWCQMYSKTSWQCSGDSDRWTDNPWTTNCKCQTHHCESLR